MRRLGEGLLELKSGQLFYHKGKEYKQSGVGFLINKRIKNNVLRVKAISDGVAGVRLKISKKYNLTVIEIYAPTSISSQEEIDDFYDDLNKILKEEKFHFNIIMGDFNAKNWHWDRGMLRKIWNR